MAHPGFDCVKWLQTGDLFEGKRGGTKTTTLIKEPPNKETDWHIQRRKHHKTVPKHGQPIQLG